MWCIDGDVLDHGIFLQTWYEKAGSDVEIQRESEHVVDAVHPGDLQQLQQRALTLLLAFVNDGVIAAQHQGVSSSLVGLRRPRVQLPSARLHVWLIKLLQHTKEIRSEKLKRSDRLVSVWGLLTTVRVSSSEPTCRLKWDDDNDGGTNPLITMSMSKTPSESTPLATWVRRRISPVWRNEQTVTSLLIYKHAGGWWSCLGVKVCMCKLMSVVVSAAICWLFCKLQQNKQSVVRQKLWVQTLSF